MDRPGKEKLFESRRCFPLKRDEFKGSGKGSGKEKALKASPHLSRARIPDRERGKQLLSRKKSSQVLSCQGEGPRYHLGRTSFSNKKGEKPITDTERKEGRTSMKVGEKESSPGG